MTRSPTAPEPDDVEAWAKVLKQNWELRSRNPKRDFYVASHRGWDDPGRWSRQAEVDIQTMFWGLEPQAVRGWQVLEVGCGVGRLAEPLLGRVGGYTGFDVAPGLVEEARSRCRDLERARFFVGDGLGVPEEARDRDYDLALAVAVFIHCPRTIIESNIRSACSLLRPGAELRIQVLADPEDAEGIESLEAASTDHAEMQAVEDEEADEEVLELIEDHYYMGDRFGHAELEPFLRDATGAEVTVFRPTLQHMYAILRMPGQ